MRSFPVVSPGGWLGDGFSLVGCLEVDGGVEGDVAHEAWLLRRVQEDVLLNLGLSIVLLRVGWVLGSVCWSLGIEIGLLTMLWVGVVVVVGLVHVDVDYFGVHVHVDVHGYVLVVFVEGRSALAEVLVQTVGGRSVDEMVVMGLWRDAERRFSVLLWF